MDALTNAQIEELSSLLEAQRNALERENAQTATGGSQSAQQIRLRLQQTRAALSLVRTGEYGFCRRCDESIGYERLRERPETPFCLDCQSRADGRR